MKKLYLIGGTMGVGKTTVCKLLNKKLPRSVFLDGDNCWDMHPFVVNEETKRMVIDNICHTLNNFIKCSVYENIIFCWVLHEQSIINNILSQLNACDLNIVNISLLVGESQLRYRLQKDISSGLRSGDIIEKSIARLPLYKRLDTVKINTDNLTPEQIAREIIKAVN